MKKLTSQDLHDNVLRKHVKSSDERWVLRVFEMSGRSHLPLNCDSNTVLEISCITET